MSKKLKILIIIFLIFIILIFLYFLVSNKLKQKNSSIEISNIDRIIQEQIKLENEEHNLGDVIAVVNDEQIIYFEYLTVKSQIKSLKQEKDQVEFEENLLLRLVQDKIKINMAKTYPTYTNMTINTEKLTNDFEQMWQTKKDEYLNSLNITYNFLETDEKLHDYLLSYYLNMYGMNIGTDIAFKIMLQRPEIASDDHLKSIIEKYNSLSSSSLDMLNQIYSYFLEDCVKNASIEFPKEQSLNSIDISYLANFE